MCLISRDPFARLEIHREVVKTASGCRWCGRKRRGGGLFQYRTESDGGREWTHPGLFCSKPCHDAYHG